MNLFLDDFENLKLSALNKAKLINAQVKDVTIGPNSIKTPNNIKTPNSIKTECKNVSKYTSSEPNGILQNSNKQKDARKTKKVTFLLKEKIPVRKMLVEVEAQRKDEVESSIQSRLKNIQAVSLKLDSDNKIEWLQRQQNLIEQNRKQEDFILQVLQEHDKKACDHLQKLQLQYQKQADERHRRNMELQNKERQKQQMQQQIVQLMEAIHKEQQAFRAVYQEIVGILKGCSNSKSVNKILTNNANIKSLPETMDKIKEKCKIGKASNSDLDNAKSLVQEVMKLKEVISQEVLLMNEQEQVIINSERTTKEISAESARSSIFPQVSIAQQVYTAQPVSLAPQVSITPQIYITQQLPAKQLTSTTVSSSSPEKTIASNVDFKFVSKDSLLMFAELQKYLENYEKSYSDLLNDPKMKKFKFACQKAVNIPLNAISSISSHHMQDKYQRLANLLGGKNVEAGGTVVCATRHPQGIFFCTDLLARKFVLQGDLIISSNPESAHCFSAILVALWIDYPDFGKLILAHFHKEAPYLVPIYPPMIKGQTDEDYYRSLGYKYEDGQVEKHGKFLKRMTGIIRLYSAVIVSRLRRGQTRHPHGLTNAWRWLTSILNLEPSVDITATLIFDFLEVAGSAMQVAYGTQFWKLIIYLNEVFLPRIQSIDSGGPVTRLEVLLQKIKLTGHIDPPRGQLPSGFW